MYKEYKHLAMGSKFPSQMMEEINKLAEDDWEIAFCLSDVNGKLKGVIMVRYVERGIDGNT